MAKQKSFLETLRAAVKKDGRTTYAIAKASGITPIMLARFMSGKTVSVETFQKLCLALGLELRPK